MIAKKNALIVFAMGVASKHLIVAENKTITIVNKNSYSAINNALTFISTLMICDSNLNLINY